jgi:hypothetical protein
MSSKPLSTSSESAVRGTIVLGGCNGYRIDGDHARLDVSIATADAVASAATWDVALWACASVPTGVQDLVACGHLVARGEVPPVSELAGTGEAFEVSTFATPPAGDREWTMAIGLMDRSSGAVADFSVFARRERFVAPRLGGTVGYAIAEDGRSVTLRVGRVENPRGIENLSGDLSLELWAVEVDYTGGVFRGHASAGASLGRLAGGRAWNDLVCELTYGEPPVGSWQVVLMLREWTAAGYVTRDFACFPTRFEVAAAASPRVEDAELAVESAPEAAAAADGVVEAAVRDERLERLNTVDVAGLRAIRGVTETLARAITKARPFASVDALRRVKGVGPKLFEKIRSSL